MQLKTTRGCLAVWRTPTGVRAVQPGRVKEIVQWPEDSSWLDRHRPCGSKVCQDERDALDGSERELARRQH